MGKSGSEGPIGRGLSLCCMVASFVDTMLHMLGALMRSGALSLPYSKQT